MMVQEVEASRQGGNGLGLVRSKGLYGFGLSSFHCETHTEEWKEMGREREPVARRR